MQNVSKVHTQQQQQHQLLQVQVEELESRLYASDVAKQLLTLRAQELEKELHAARDAQSRVENELREKEALICELQAERAQFSTLSERERVPVENAGGCSGEEEAIGDGTDGNGDDAADHDQTAMHLHKRYKYGSTIWLYCYSHVSQYNTVCCIIRKDCSDGAHHSLHERIN